MKILWVEDEIGIEKILDYFSLYLTNSEIKKIQEMDEDFSDVKEFLKEETVNKIFISSYLNDSLELIQKQEIPFDKIILDINFPFNHSNNKFNLSDLLKDSFFGKESDYPEFIKSINEEKYAGIILNHLIVGKYKDKYRWNKKDIQNNIVFLSSNNITYKDFEKSITDVYKQAFRYDSDGAGIQFFDKNKNITQFKEWLKTDKYTLILDRCGENAVKNFLEVTKSKDSKDPQIIKSNLVNLRQLIENHIAKTIVFKILNNSNIIPKWNPQIIKSDGKLNMGEFLSTLNSIIPVLDKKDHKEKGFFLLTDEEIKRLFNSLSLQNNFSERGVFKISIGALETAIQQKNTKSLNDLLKSVKNINELTFKFENRLNSKLKVTETIYFYIQNCWSILSELIHDSNELNEYEIDYKFTLDTERAVNTINIIYYQLKEIIIWFGEVMEYLQSQK